MVARNTQVQEASGGAGGSAATRGGRTRLSRNAFAAALALAAGLGLAGQAAAGPHRGCGKGGHGPGDFADRVEELDLAPETERAVDDLLGQSRDQQRDLRRQLREAHERMHDLLRQDAAPVKEILALADSIGTLETSLHKSRLQTLLKIRGLLTPEQWREVAPEPRRGRGPEAEGPEESGEEDDA